MNEYSDFEKNKNDFAKKFIIAFFSIIIGYTIIVVVLSDILSDKYPIFRMSNMIILTVLLSIIFSPLSFLYFQWKYPDSLTPKFTLKKYLSENEELSPYKRDRLEKTVAIYKQSKKDFFKGKIDKETLKERLKPYKDELIELKLIKFHEGEIQQYFK